VIIVIGVLLWLINNYLPMDGKIKSILNPVAGMTVFSRSPDCPGLLPLRRRRKRRYTNFQRP
jgi:hypothetical protein